MHVMALVCEVCRAVWEVVWEVVGGVRHEQVCHVQRQDKVRAR